MTIEIDSPVKQKKQQIFNSRVALPQTHYRLPSPKVIDLTEFDDQHDDVSERKIYKAKRRSINLCSEASTDASIVILDDNENEENKVA